MTYVLVHLIVCISFTQRNEIVHAWTNIVPTSTYWFCFISFHYIYIHIYTAYNFANIVFQSTFLCAHQLSVAICMLRPYMVEFMLKRISVLITIRTAWLFISARKILVFLSYYAADVMMMEIWIGAIQRLGYRITNCMSDDWKIVYYAFMVHCWALQIVNNAHRSWTFWHKGLNEILSI